MDKQDRAVAVQATVDVAARQEHFDTAFARIAGRFGRVEPRRRARSFLLGLLSDVDTRSCWQLAEQAGDASPHAMQRLLGEAVWDAAQVAVFSAYASAKGRALVDRDVYLPKVWTDDPERCQTAGVPDDVRFATKVTLGRRMLTRALDAACRPGGLRAGLLTRRRISDGELAYYRCWSPTRVTLAALVRVAGIRWCVEECFQAGKGEVGLDQHQVRN